MLNKFKTATKVKSAGPSAQAASAAVSASGNSHAVRIFLVPVNNCPGVQGVLQPAGIASDFLVGCLAVRHNQMVNWKNFL
jgi:hypothetical protein